MALWVDNFLWIPPGSFQSKHQVLPLGAFVHGMSLGSVWFSNKQRGGNDRRRRFYAEEQSSSSKDTESALSGKESPWADWVECVERKVLGKVENRKCGI